MSSTPVPPMVDLDAWDRLGVMFLAGAILMAAFVLVVCSVADVCWLYKYCPFNKKRQKGGEMDTTYGAVDELGSEKKGSSKAKSGSERMSELSDYWSDSTVLDGLDIKPSSGRHTPSRELSTSPGIFIETRELQKPGVIPAKLVFSITYVTTNETVQLNIRKIHLSCETGCPELTAPYLKVQFIRGKRKLSVFKDMLSRGKSNGTDVIDIELQSKAYKAAERVSTNDVFFVKIELDDLKIYTLRLTLCDLDTFSRHIMIGEVSVDLSSLVPFLDKELAFTEEVQPPTQDYKGDVQVCLNFLPTAEKLSLNVVGLRGLKVPDASVKEINSFVKVILMHEGKQKKKTKTKIVSESCDPTFNAEFTFDVPKNLIETVYIALSACHHHQERKGGVLIGRVYLGLNCGSDAHAHWNEMMHYPRNNITAWHRLQ